MDNIRVDYLYRDASNHKRWNSVVFANPDGLTAELVTESLRESLLEGCLFVATQIRLPECFLFAAHSGTSDDHCFHEFDIVERTSDAENDVHSRSIFQFTQEVEREARLGWVEFDAQSKASGRY